MSKRTVLLVAGIGGAVGLLSLCVCGGVVVAYYFYGRPTTANQAARTSSEPSGVQQRDGAKPVEGSPKSETADEVKAWIIKEKADLREVEQKGNPIALRQAAAKSTERFSALNGKTVTWSLHVSDISNNEVSVHFNDDSGARLFYCVRLKRADRKHLVILGDTIPLLVGPDISLPAAAKLKRGDVVRVTGRIQDASVADPGMFTIVFQTLKAVE